MHMAIDSNYMDKLSIRLNYDKENVQDQIQLLDYLASEFDVNRLIITFGWITNAAEEPSSTVFIHDNVLEIKEHVEAYVSLYAHARQLGFKMMKYFPINGLCISKRNQSVLMCPDGNYYKCGGLVGRDSHSAGKVGSELMPQSYHYPDLYDECFDRKCELIPLCYGGCRLDAFYHDGHLHSLECKYGLLKDINIELLKLNYINVPDKIVK